MPNNNSQRVIIVGSGPGGLASALLLAHSGVDVTVLEKAEAVGGRTRLYKKDGYTFDRGPTFFHYPEVIEEIFQAIGKLLILILNNCLYQDCHMNLVMYIHQMM